MDGWKGRDVLEEEWWSRWTERAEQKAEQTGGWEWVRRMQWSEGALESFPTQFAFIVSSFTSPTTLRLC